MSKRFSELLNGKLPSQKNSRRNGSYGSFFESGFDSSDDDISVADIEEAIDKPFEDDSSNDDIFGDDESDDSSEQQAEDSEEIDDTIKRVATPIIVEEILDEGEVAVFKESTDSDIAIDEGFFTERTIVRLNNGAKKKQVLKVSVLAIARKKKDPMYAKLLTLWKMERTLEAKLYRKYENEAKQKAKKFVRSASKSRSKVVKKAARRVVKR